MEEFVEVEVRSGRKGRGRILGTRKALVHQCSVCSERGPWTDSWIWYGSYQELEDGDPIVKMCGDQCAAHARATKLVPKNAPRLDD